MQTPQSFISLKDWFKRGKDLGLRDGIDYKGRDSGFIFLLEKFTYKSKDYNISSELFPYVFKETFSDREGGQLLFLLYKYVDSFN